MRILVDTNVVLDILLKRTEFVQDSYGALEKAYNKGDILFLSASAITDIYYLIRKETSNKAMALDSIKKLCVFFSLAEVNDSSIILALNSRIKDFEDAVVDSVAQQIKADFILTRNEKDFIGSKTIAKTPLFYLNEMN